MRASRKTLINSALGVVIVGAVVAGVILLNPFGSSTAETATQLTSTVQQGTLSSTITATGNVQPVREVTTSFSVSGKIAKVNVAVGDTVKSGSTLGTLATDTLDSQLSAAYSQLSTAQSNLTLANSGLTEAKAAVADPPASGGSVASVSSATQQVNSAKSSVTSASSAVTTAKANLESATLKAPISGLIIAVNGSVGDAASTGGGATSFVTIADTSELTVTAAIAEADIASVTIGQTATVTFPALDNATAPATVTAIAPTATSSNSIVTYSTTITLSSVPDNLRLGQTADVSITTASSAADALYVPSAAITTVNGESTIKVVADDGTTTAVTVTLGIVGDAGTEITSGLTAGETIVLGTVPASTTSTTGTTDTPGFGGGREFPGGGVPGGNRGTNQGGGN